MAIGRALVVDRGTAQIFRSTVPAAGVERETARLEAAIGEAREQLLVIKNKLSKSAMSSYGFVFEAHLLFLDDRHLVGDALRLPAAYRVLLRELQQATGAVALPDEESLTGSIRMFENVDANVIRAA